MKSRPLRKRRKFNDCLFTSSGAKYVFNSRYVINVFPSQYTIHGSGQATILQ